MTLPAASFKRAYSPRELLSKKIHRIKFDGEEWADLFGHPSRYGVWFCWGNSGNGKTEFVMRLLRLFSANYRTLYVSLEEGLGNVHLQEGLLRNGLGDAGNLLISFDTVEELAARLRKDKSPRVVVIDTVQYWGITIQEYKALVKEFDDRLFVFMSHVTPDGRTPDGATALKIKKDSDLRLWIEGFKAFCQGRTWGRTNEYVIWPQGAAAYWGRKEKGGKNDKDGKDAAAQSGASTGMGDGME